MSFDILSICLGWLLIALGFLGCILPILPGPPIAFCALLLARFACSCTQPTTGWLILAGVCVAASALLDYLVPILGARAFKCSKAGTTGCIIGTIAGLFFLPLGLLLGPFLGALVGESCSGRKLGASFLSATGVLLGFIVGSLLKLLCCGFIAFLYYSATMK